MATYLTALARRGQRGTIGDREHQRLQGGRDARRSGCCSERDIRNRVAHSDVVHPRHPRSDRRGLAGSGGQPRFAARRAAGGAAVGRGPVAHPGVLAFDDGVDVGDADDRRNLRRDGHGVGADGTGPRRVSALARPRRRIAVSPRQGRNPLRRRPSAAAGPRRHRLGRAAERDRRAHHRGRRADPGAVLVDAGRPGRGRGHARTVVHAGVVSRRRQHLHAGRAVHRGSRPPRCSARCRCGRASTCRGRRCRWC